MSSTESRYDDPVELAHAIALLERPTLVVFDCDGVLAPLTDHADDSTLTPDVGAALTRLARHDGITVAVLSGRSLAGLEQFDFDASIEVRGSYGAERRGLGHVELSDEEAGRLRSLDALLTDAAERAGQGAWVERKPTSVVVHVREADPVRGREALEWAMQRQLELDGHTCHEGSNVLELMTRDADKGTALDALRCDVEPESCVYLGDDVPDEEAFARLGEGDLSVKVGPGTTMASRRIADPDAVRAMLDALLVELPDIEAQGR